MKSIDLVSLAAVYQKPSPTHSWKTKAYNLIHLPFMLFQELLKHLVYSQRDLGGKLCYQPATVDSELCISAHQ